MRPIGSKNIKWDKEVLQDLYWDKGMNCNQIAKQFGTVPQAVLRAMKMFNIPRRSLSEVTSGEKHYAWKGGINKTSTGYIEVYMPKHHKANKRGYVKQHVLVWEQAHGRKLKDNEIIHHLNGIKSDNRPENLVAMSNNEHRLWIPKLQMRIRELEKELKRCCQEVMELG